MRQRRHALQVSTFPFLAVLLCTMGSLILLLLVIDRRTRVVARAKAVRAAALLAAEDAAVQARRQAELDRRQQALHAQLQGQDQEVMTQIRAADQKSTAAVESVRQEQKQIQELQEKFQAESARLTQGQEEVRAKQAGMAQTAAQTQEARRDLARLTGELTQLERTLADLKEARKRDEHRYSLVPYRGRHGDNRRPLYVECAEESIRFHPDRAALAGLEMTPANIRTAVEQRLARKRADAGAKEKDQTPYLLLLVRPNGIRTYYKTLSALEGLKIDFGYEFVEADWVLDFPETEGGAVQPWMVAGQAPAGLPPAPRAAGPKAPAGNSSSAGGLSGGGVETSTPAGVRLGGAAIAQNEPGAPGLPSVSRVPGPLPLGGTGVGLGIPGGAGTGSPAVAAPAGPGGTPADATGRIGDPSGAPGGLAIRPTLAGGGGPGLPSADPLQLRQPAGATAGVTAGANPSGSALLEVPNVGDSGAPAVPSLNPGQLAAGSGSAPATSPALRPLETLATPPIESDTSGDGRSPVGGRGSPLPFGGSVGRTTGDNGRRGGEARSDEPAAEGRPVLPPVLPDRSPPPRPAPPERPRVLGNRDWVASVDCTAAEVIVYPGGQRIAATALATAPGDNPLFKVVQSLISRRQAMVRPGEPPYRPVVRFLVHPDGLRTYYLAYPALESLQVAMIRENVRPEKQPDGR